MHIASLRCDDVNDLVAVFDGCLTGLPVNVAVQSEHEVSYGDSHTLSWTVHSLSPLISYQLQLRDLSDSVSYSISFSYVHLQNKFVQ